MPHWPSYDNGPLERISQHHWHLLGFLPRNGLGRTLDVFRLADGRLVVHNPICLDEAGMAELEALGPVAFLVVPSGLHRTDIAAWKARYPDAQVLCPPGCRTGVAKVVPVDGDYSLLPEDPYLRVELLDGTGDKEGVFIASGEGGVSLVVADALFNLPHSGGCAGLLVRMLGSSGGPRVTPLAKRTLVADRAHFAAHLRRLADLPRLARVLPAHREPIDQDVAAVLRAVADAV
jgi:hypothetical protein